MELHPRFIKRTVFALLLSILSAPLTTWSQSTAFTYQGRLTDHGSPASGSYDFTSALFGTNSGVTPVGGPLTNSAVTVSNGLFTLLLDFGAGAFDGQDYFLEIAVRLAGGGAFTPLSPRQLVSPAPWATFATRAGNLRSGAVTHLNNLQNDVTLAAGSNVTITPIGNTLTIGSDSGGGSPWLLNGTNIFYNAGFVGIGTQTPDRPLAIEGAGSADEWISFQTANTTRWHINNHNLGWNLAQTGVADGRLFVSQGGNVGVGTDVPAAKLDVHGDIRLGSTGQFRAPGGEENLRIIRGVVSGAGGILVGSGFTVTHGAPAGGQYTVTFNTAFNGPPAVTATADLDGRVISTVGVTSASANFQVRFLPSGVTDAAFHFIAIGPR